MLTYYIHTFGCQMNESDSERFRTIIERIGYQPISDWKQADLLVFNSCSVRQKAEDRIIGMGPQVKQLKDQNSSLKVILTGCMARRTWKPVKKTASPIHMTSKDRQRQLIDEMDWIDIVLETKHFGKLPQLLGKDLQTGAELLADVEGAKHYLSYQPKYQKDFQAYVPISTGCDHFCTYCIVPFARGGEVCRPALQIINEVFNLISNGYKDITLLGQTVNRWVNPDFDRQIKKGQIANTRIPELNTQPLSTEQLDQWYGFFNSMSGGITQIPPELDAPRDFLQLIQVLDQIPGQWWTTWVSSHPNYMTPQLIDYIGKSSKAGFWNNDSSSRDRGHQRPYLHFALQSGNDLILKRMNRRHTFAEFKSIVDRMYKQIPNMMLSTDIIVGFPREMEEHFQDTLAAQRVCKFDMIYISEYSPRTGTASALLPDNVPHQDKERRKNELNELLKQIAYAKNENLVNTQLTVLVERIDKRTGEVIGRAENFKVVRIKGKTDINLIGEFIPVKIISHTPWALTGINIR